MKSGDDIEYPAILAQMDKGIDVDVIDAINAMRWRCDNQRREMAKLNARHAKVLEALRTLFAACDSPVIRPKWLGPMTDEQIKYMVDRFLGWRLPEHFSPDAGISFKPTFNDHMPHGPQKHNPSGTNLFDAGQAEAMIRYLVDGLPAKTA